MKLLKVDTIEEVRNKLEEHLKAGMPGNLTETVSLRSAAGRYLAENVSSDMDMPQFRRSVVDGYAVIAKDTFGVSDSIPVFLEVIGSVNMGEAAHYTLLPGQAVYIPTGGMLPEGSDAVVMIEFTEKLDDRTIAVYKPAAPNNGIMNQGDDFQKEQLLFKIGHRITVKDIGMLAAAGKAEVAVFQKPRMTIISTGDEIIDVAEIPKYGEIRDINSYTIAAFAERTGAEVTAIHRLPDVYDKLRNTLLEAVRESDIVLLSGGSSAGNKDMTADIIDSIGSPGVITHGIAMKPGKPTIVGIVENKLIVGLPGHPMAAIIAYHAVVEEFILKHCFCNREDPLSIIAEVTENIHAGEGRETFQLVSLKKTDHWIAEPIHAKSGSISQLMIADGYIRIPSLSEGVYAGSNAEIYLI